MITLYLIRHGETVWNKSGQYQGANDVPLSTLGTEQAEKVRDWFRDMTLDGVISSTLSRAVDTAQGIADDHELVLEKTPLLRELSFGEWEGKTFREIESLWPGQIDEMYHHPERMMFPGGETFQDAQRRCMSYIDELIRRGDDKTYAIVSHGAALRTVVCGLLGLPLHLSWNLSFANAGISTVKHFVGDRSILGLLNMTEHLK